MSTSKNKIIVGLVVLMLALPLLAFAAACPVCGGRVVKTAAAVGRHEYAQQKLVRLESEHLRQSVLRR